MTGWYFWIFGAATASLFASWLIFGRFSMARIERDIHRAGLSRPCPWDGPGARIMWYAFAIALPVGVFNRIDDPIIDVPLVRKFAVTRDQWRAWFLIASLASIFVIGLYGWWFNLY